MRVRLSVLIFAGFVTTASAQTAEQALAMIFTGTTEGPPFKNSVVSDFGNGAGKKQSWEHTIVKSEDCTYNIKTDFSEMYSNGIVNKRSSDIWYDFSKLESIDVRVEENNGEALSYAIMDGAGYRNGRYKNKISKTLFVELKGNEFSCRKDPKSGELKSCSNTVGVEIQNVNLADRIRKAEKYFRAKFCHGYAF